MKINKLPSLEYLKQCFILEASLPSGLRWSADRPFSHFKSEALFKRWKTNNSNQSAGCILNNGYYYSRLDKNRYPNHRIVFRRETFGPFSSPSNRVIQQFRELPDSAHN